MTGMSRRIDQSETDIARREAAKIAARKALPPLPIELFEGELTSNLDAPIDGKTSDKTATVKRWIPDETSTSDPVEMLLDSEELTLVNRSKVLVGVTGDYVIFVQIGLEYRVIWIDCS